MTTQPPCKIYRKFSHEAQFGRYEFLQVQFKEKLVKHWVFLDDCGNFRSACQDHSDHIRRFPSTIQYGWQLGGACFRLGMCDVAV